MRELKFRFWSRDTNEMWSAQDLIDNAFYLLADVSVENSFDNGVDRSGDFIIMQYTGLKDKNGTEIYEGDIVSYGGYTDGSGDCKYKVVWDDSHGQWSGIEIRNIDYRGGLVTSLDPFCTVIGNIYENPELLKETDD